MLKSLITLARIDIEPPVRLRQKGTRGGRLSRRDICACERNQRFKHTAVLYNSWGGVGLLAQHLCNAGETATMEVFVVVPSTQQQSYLHHPFSRKEQQRVYRSDVFAGTSMPTTYSK